MTELDPAYVAARRTLIDVLVALSPHADAIVVVGAHAVYLRTGDAGIAVAPYTTDADLVVNPAVLGERPQLESLLEQAGFVREPNRPGAWTTGDSVSHAPIPIDIMVPAGVAPGTSRRSVPLLGHDKMATRRAVGLEPSLIDNDRLPIHALDPADTRSVTTRVAGPTALVVAKLHKLHDRIAAGDKNRLADKDAADVFRLMQTTDVSAFVAMSRVLMADEVARRVTDEALGFMRELFGARALPGVRMAVSALTPAVPEERVVGVTAAFVGQALGQLRP